MTENEQKRLQKIRDKIALAKQQEKALLSREKERKRKERTRRLIQNGALAEKYLNCENMPPNEFEIFLKQHVKNIKGADNDENTN